MIKKSRLRDTPADYAQLNLDPQRVLDREDGRRDTATANHNEVWYFDGLFDDGSKVVVGFRPRDPYAMAITGDRPNFNILITQPNGETRQDFVYTDHQPTTLATDHLDVHFGKSFATGDW